MANANPYRKCIEEIRNLYGAYEEAISVSVGTDKYNNPEILFTIIKKEEKGDNE